MLNLKTRPFPNKLFACLSRTYFTMRTLLLNQGLLWVILLARYILLLLIILRFNLMPALLHYPEKLPVWVSIIYALYVTGVLLIRGCNRQSFESNASKAVQIAVDIVFFFIVYWSRGNVESDSFFFLLLPLLLACRYFNNKVVFGVVSLMMVFLAFICFSFPKTQVPDAWLPPPFQAPLRYILLFSIWGLHYIFYYHIQTLERIKTAFYGEALLPGTHHLHPHLNEIVELLEPLEDSKANKSLVQEITTKLFSRHPSNLPQLRQAAVEIAAEMLNCESVAIFLVENRQAHRVNVTGIVEAEFNEEIYQVGQGLTGKTFRWSEEKQRLVGEIHACNYVSTYPGTIPHYVQTYRELLYSKKLEHLMAAPIEDEDELYAVIRVMNKKDMAGNLHPFGFSIKDKEVLSIIAMLVSYLWRQYLGFKVMEQLIAIGEKLAKASPRAKIYREASYQAVSLLAVEDCCIFEVDEAGWNLRLVGSNNVTEGEFDRWGISLEADHSLMATVIRTREVYLPQGAEIHHQEPGLDFDNLPSGHCHSLMLVPFFNHLNRCLGIIMIRNKNRPDPHSNFRGEDERAARLLASLLGSAIQSEILYEREKRQEKRRQDILTQFSNLQTHVFAGMQNPPSTLQEIARTARELMGAVAVCILPYYDNFQGITGFNSRWVTISQLWADLKIDLAEISPPRPRGMTWKAIHHESGYIVEEINLEDERVTPFLKRLGIRQVLGLPVKAQGHNFGAIFFDYTQVSTLTPEDIYLATLIAGLTAQALMNAEYQNLKDLNEIRANAALKLQENNLTDITNGISQLAHLLLDGLIYARNRLDLAMRETTTPQQQRNYLKIAHGHIERSQKVIKCIMDYNLLKAEGHNGEPVDLSSVVIEVIGQHQETARSKTVELVCASQGKLPLVLFNPAIAHAILDNLLTNALRHTPPTGTIEVGYYQYQDKVYITVKDSGLGMDEETRHTVFKVPLLGKNQTGKSIKGTGLGLYFANQLIEASNGRIWVEESRPGKGTTITFELPVAKADDMTN